LSETRIDVHGQVRVDEDTNAAYSSAVACSEEQFFSGVVLDGCFLCKSAGVVSTDRHPSPVDRYSKNNLQIRYRPLICTLKIAPPRLKQVERCGAPRIKWWRMREGSSCNFSRAVTDSHDCRRNLEKATDAIRQAAQSELGITKPGRRKVDKQARCGQMT
uniref:DDE Tnp4 domain-containing protein n=1 Tax=Heligmosomoides polygyrus TaxID=6339 RepID=A0A183GPQ5_HELPZ